MWAQAGCDIKRKGDFENKAFPALTWSAETKAARTNMMLRWQQSQVHALLCLVLHLQHILLPRASDLQEDARRAPEGQGEDSSRKRSAFKNPIFLVWALMSPESTSKECSCWLSVWNRSSSAHEPAALQLISTLPSPQRDHLPDTEVNTVHTQCP